MCLYLMFKEAFKWVAKQPTLNCFFFWFSYLVNLIIRKMFQALDNTSYQKVLTILKDLDPRPPPPRFFTMWPVKSGVRVFVL